MFSFPLFQTYFKCIEQAYLCTHACMPSWVQLCMFRKNVHARRKIKLRCCCCQTKWTNVVCKRHQKAEVLLLRHRNEQKHATTGNVVLLWYQDEEKEFMESTCMFVHDTLCLCTIVIVCMLRYYRNYFLHTTSKLMPLMLCLPIVQTAIFAFIVSGAIHLCCTRDMASRQLSLLPLKEPAISISYCHITCHKS